MHPSRWLLLAGGVLGLASLGTAYLVVPSRTTIGGIDGAGWPGAVLLGLVGLVGLVGDRREGLQPILAIGVALLAALATVFAVEKTVDAVLAARRLTALGIPAHPGAGIWLLAGGAVVALAGSAVGLSRRLG